MTRHIAGFAFLALMAFGVASAAAAYEAPAGKVEYRIHHSKYDLIGSHVVTFSRNGDEQVVKVVLKIKVKFLFISLHSLVSERREVWRGDSFVGYRAHTDENTDLTDVTARMTGGKLVINGPGGRVEAPDTVFPTHPWNPEIVNHTLLMDTKTGKLLKVSTRAAGAEPVDVAGKPVSTKKYVTSGDMDRELWFDGKGNLIQFRFVRDGSTLTFTRTTPMP